MADKQTGTSSSKAFSLLGGVEFGDTEIRGFVGKESGEVLRSVHFPVDGGSTNPQDLLTRGAEALQVSATRAGIDSTHLTRLGFVFSGPTDAVNRSVQFMANVPGWEKPVAVGEILDTLFPEAKIAVCSNASAAALGESRFGAGQGYNNVLLISLGSEVRAGIVINSKLYTGVRGLAGEIGHMHFGKEEYRECSCGRFDCVETYLSNTGIALTVERRLHIRVDTPYMLAQFAQGHYSWVRKFFRRYGEDLGEFIGSLSNILDPDIILLAGGVMTGSTAFPSKLVQQAAQERSVKGEELKVEIASLPNPVIPGALVLAAQGQLVVS